MGKKTKSGKQRKDKFYQLAKETGYRARSAFKLIQLNRKYEFLQTSRVVIDLCAAPGGWLQVARENMPVSSLIIGVDLFPIKAIPNVITLQEDITTDKCRQSLRKELKNWNADVVLNDGAPNVGKNWLHDAYQQARLTLAALKLSTKMLRRGGWFVTKVFRSKDYHSLLFIFKKLFKKVFATKPQASRKESAEIFVVCQHYLAPDKIDPKFLDEKYVFEELETEPKKTINLFRPQKDKRRAEGYPETAGAILETVIDASEFINQENYLELLSQATQIHLDKDWISQHSATTNEVKECCNDVKVLGRPELKSLIAWRKKLRDEQEKKKEEKAKETTQKEKDEEEDLEKQIAELKEAEKKAEKKKRKQIAKERKKLVQRLNLKMTIKNDEPLIAEEGHMFSLKTVNRADLTDKTGDVILEEDEHVEGDLRPRFEKYNRDTDRLDDSGRFYRKADDEVSSSDESDSDDEDEVKKGLGLSDSDSDQETTKKRKLKGDGEVEEEEHPLLVDPDARTKEGRKKKRAEMWFDRDIFEDVNEDDDEDFEIETMASQYKKKGGKILSKPENEQESGYTSDEEELEMDEVGDKDDVDSSSDEENHKDELSDEGSDSDSDSDEEVDTVSGGKKEGVPPSDQDAKGKKRVLDPQALALGTMMIKSKKAKRDILDDGWNRYAFNDEGLPEWFVRDEKKHNRMPPNIESEALRDVRERLKEINARSIKKVVEAKARKKKRAHLKLEKLRKKAEAVCENMDISEKEKALTIKKMYRKAGPKKKELTYVVASKKIISGKKVARPPGIKGPYKMVDPRMKKDVRNRRAREKKGGKKHKGRRKTK